MHKNVIIFVAKTVESSSKEMTSTSRFAAASASLKFSCLGNTRNFKDGHLSALQMQHEIARCQQI